MVQKLEDRPPYVRFEVRAQEDRQASIEAGHYVGRDVDYVLVTPMGSKDCVERRVDEWLAKLQQDVGEGRCPQEWYKGFKLGYEEWKAGRESPVKGTPILEWPPISPAQVKTLQSLGVRSVEDLAVANEEVLSRLGMGARALKQKALDWLEASKSGGKTAEEINALRVALTNLQARNESLEAQINSLQASQQQQAKAK